MALVAAGLALASALTATVMIDGGLPGAFGSGRAAPAVESPPRGYWTSVSGSRQPGGARGARALRSQKEASQHAPLDRRRRRDPARRHRPACRGSLALDG